MKKNAKIALVYGEKLGDGIVGMTLTRNFYLNGYKPITFSDSAYELRSFFPNYPIEPMSACTDERLKEFEVAIYPYACPIVGSLPPQGVERIAFRDYPFFEEVRPMREFFAKAAFKLFNFSTFEPSCGAKCTFKTRFHKRVAIHTSASEPLREWGKKRFDRLAKELEDAGFEPVYLISSQEKQRGESYPCQALSFDSLLDLAQFLAESAYFIGADSGPGHLAALVGTPTLTLGHRKTVLKRWAPTANLSDCVFPLPILPTSRLRGDYWRNFLSPKRVLKHFLLLTERKSA